MTLSRPCTAWGTKPPVPDRAAFQPIAALGRIRFRLLVVNLIVVLVPVAGLEFADIYEQQLLDALERDMRNQSVLARRMVEANLDAGRGLFDERTEHALARAAEDTRTRIRVLSRRGGIVMDSHANGPPEGPEPPAPSLLMPLTGASDAGPYQTPTLLRLRPPWPLVSERGEVREALSGRRSSFTRIRDRHPAVILFLAEPVMRNRRVQGAVYVTRSTQPVLLELYRIRTGLVTVLAVAVVFTLLVTILLALSISRPLSRLSRAAKRIARGERDVRVPVGGGGEIRELGESFATMTAELDGRLRYISDFAADVAHEFKSPLTSIRGAAELLGEGAADEPEARRRFLGNIELDVARLDRLVSRLLELSRIEASQEAMGEVDLRGLIEEVVGRRPPGDAAVDVRWLASDEPLLGRRADLDAVFANLVDNAARYAPEGTRVTITAHDTPEQLVVAVSDGGPGVPVSQRDKVFERFFTTDAAQEGTGLGLAIVRTVVQAHGGVVELGETEGGGATFRVSLPRR